MALCIWIIFFLVAESTLWTLLFKLENGLVNEETNYAA